MLLQFLTLAVPRVIVDGEVLTRVDRPNNLGSCSMKNVSTVLNVHTEVSWTPVLYAGPDALLELKGRAYWIAMYGFNTWRLSACSL